MVKRVASEAKEKSKSKRHASSKMSSDTELNDLDRRSLAAKARQVKRELLAIRFNLQSPSLQEYRKKKSDLVKILSHLN